MKKIVGIGIILFLVVILLIQVFDNTLLVNDFSSNQSTNDSEEQSVKQSTSKDTDTYIENSYSSENLSKIIELDDDYSVEIKLDINEKTIYNILFFTYYQGSEEVWGKEHANICNLEPQSHECNSYTLDTSLNNIGLYIICKGEFPKEHFDLTDEQYENLKEEYESFVANPTVEYTSVSGKCISDKGY